MKRTIFFAILFLLFSFTMAYGTSLDEISDYLDRIFIKSVNAVRISESPDELKIVLTLNNETRQTFRVEKGEFEVIINPDNISSRLLPEDPPKLKEKVVGLGGASKLLPETTLVLGKTKPFDFTIGKCEEWDDKGNCKTPGEEPLEVIIPLSPISRKQIVYKLINYLGLPGARKKILLRGNVMAGIKNKKNESNLKKINLELYYKPKIQSESLFVGW